MVAEAISPIFLVDQRLALRDEQEEKLSEFSAWFEKMEKKRLWFKERTPEELNQIIPGLQTLAKGKTMLPRKALSSLVESGLVKADVATRLARNLWKEVLTTIQAVALENVPDSNRFKISEQAADRITQAITLNILKPLGFQDGYVNVFDFYEAGAALIQFKEVEENEDGEKPRKLVVHFPLLHKGERRLACLVLPDDDEVLFVHRWREGCGEIKPLITPRQIREINKD